MERTLQKKIGYLSAVAIIVGSIIGSGVFMKPSSMAAELASPVWLSLVWIIAGFFTLLGAFIFAELGAMMPETGGVYVYFKKMFNDFFAYLYGWSAFAVTNTAAVAAIAFICAEYAGVLIHLPRFDTETEKSVVLNIPFIGRIFLLENMGVKSLAVFLVLLLTFLNYRTLKGGNIFQVVSTGVKVLILLLLVIAIFFSPYGSTANFFTATDPAKGTDLLNAIIFAMTGAFFAYDGWINITYVAGEIKDPKKDLPKSLIVGVCICILVYLVVNQAYLYAMPVEQIAQSPLVAADAIRVAWGDIGSKFIAFLIVITTLGAVNGNIMATCRVTYAMGKDGLFFRSAGREHKRYQTPGNALWIHAAWTCIFILTGSFNMLADMFVFITWVVYGVAAAGVMMLRKKMKNTERPYKMPGYPWVPLIFILFSAFYLFLTLYNDFHNYLNDKQPVINSLLGLLIVAMGVPLYFIFKNRPRI